MFTYRTLVWLVARPQRGVDDAPLFPGKGDARGTYVDDAPVAKLFSGLEGQEAPSGRVGVSLPGTALPGEADYFQVDGIDARRVRGKRRYAPGLGGRPTGVHRAGLAPDTGRRSAADIQAILVEPGDEAEGRKQSVEHLVPG